MKMQITFRNGVQVAVDAEKFQVFSNQLTNELTKLTWDAPEGYTSRLHFVRLDEVVAVVALREPDDDPESVPALSGEETDK